MLCTSHDLITETAVCLWKIILASLVIVSDCKYSLVELQAELKDYIPEKDSDVEMTGSTPPPKLFSEGVAPRKRPIQQVISKY